MASPDPEGMSLMSKIIAAATPTVAAVWGARTWIDKRFEKKAEKSDVEKCLKHVEKLYENAEADRKLTRDLHDKAMEAVRGGQSEIIRLLSR